MARLNVWVPDDLAARAREVGLNISALTQSALRSELDRRATDQWLDSLSPAAGAVTHDDVIAALDDGREEFGVTERP